MMFMEYHCIEEILKLWNQDLYFSVSLQFYKCDLSTWCRHFTTEFGCLEIEVIYEVACNQGSFQYKDAVLPVYDSHYKDKMVLWPANLLDEIHICKEGLYIEMGPWLMKVHKLKIQVHFVDKGPLCVYSNVSQLYKCLPTHAFLLPCEVD